MGSPADTDIKLVGVEWMEVPISRHECKALLTSLANLWPKMLFPFSDRWTPSDPSRPHYPKQEIMPAEKGIENQTILTISRALNPPSNLPSIQKRVGGMSSGWIISDRGTTLNVCQIKVSASGLTSGLSVLTVVRAHQTSIGKKQQSSYVSQGKLFLLNYVDLTARHILKVMQKPVKFSVKVNKGTRAECDVQGKEACSYFKKTLFLDSG